MEWSRELDWKRCGEVGVSHVSGPNRASGGRAARHLHPRKNALDAL